MPDPTLSEALKEAYASAPSNVVIVETLEMRHAAFTEPVRVVLAHEPMELRLESTAPIDAGAVVSFVPFAFELTLPEIIDSGIPEMGIQIDNVSQEIIKNIELAMPSPEKLEITYRAYLSNDLLGGPQNDPPLTLNITQIEADAMSIRAKASIADFINKKFPGINYTDERFPGLMA